MYITMRLTEQQYHLVILLSSRSRSLEVSNVQAIKDS